MGPVVHAAHQQRVQRDHAGRHEHLALERGTERPTPAVPEDRHATQQAEQPGARTRRRGAAQQVGDQEAPDAAEEEEHEHAGRAQQAVGLRAEAPQEVQVEADVEQAQVQHAGGQQRPPVACPEPGAARDAEQGHGVAGRAADRQQVAHVEGRRRVAHDREHVDQPADPDEQHRRVEVVPEEGPQLATHAEGVGAEGAAVGAALLLVADELPAAPAEDGASLGGHLRPLDGGGRAPAGAPARAPLRPERCCNRPSRPSRDRRCPDRRRRRRRSPRRCSRCPP